MSDDAKTLLYWMQGANALGATGDQPYCKSCARKWASYILANN